MTALQKAIQAERAAERAVQAYDRHLFASFGGRFDAERADLLAAAAAEACAAAARLTAAAGRNGAYDAARSAEFRAIAA